MCLGEIAQVAQVPGDGTAVVHADGRARTVSLLTLRAPVVAGDWVLIHSGFALEHLTAEQAHDSLAIRTATLEELP